MANLIVKHEVKDFKIWKNKFIASDTFRKIFGEKDYLILQNAENPNDVAIIFNWDDLKRLIRFFDAIDMKSIMESAGVIGEPKIYLEEEDLK